VSNIVEGFQQSTDRGFAKYLYTSKGSTAEVRARLQRALDRKYIAQKEFDARNALGEEVAK
jgi:four helix bundle protein